MADWWAAFNRDGPEIDYFRRFVEAGQPALDVACGTGRLLIPYLRADLDVDGCDVSADMIERCRAVAEREGLAPTLFVQSMHELAPPRRYRTVFVCGGFGVGSTRATDAEALVRFRDALEPGGTLVIDHEMPYSDAWLWQRWTKDEREQLPRPWGPEGERRRTADGAELTLQSRLVALDPLEQQVRMEIRARRWDGDDVVAEEEHSIDLCVYFRHELELLLERAGFVDVRVEGGYDGGEPTPDHAFLVFVARRPSL